jgi:hypothetical protein
MPHSRKLLCWFYGLTALVALVSVTFPLFLIARERRLSTRGEATAVLGITPLDAVGLAALAVPMAALTLWTLVR